MPDRPPDAFDVVWVVEGTDTFGTSQTIGNLAGQLAAEGLTSAFVVVGEGPFADRLRNDGWPVDARPAGIPTLVSGLAPRATAAVCARWLTSSLRTGFALRRHPWLRRARVVHLLRPNLLLAAGLAGWGRSRVVWEMANAVGGPDAAAVVYRLLCRALRVRVVANSGWTALSLLRGARRPPVPVMHLSADPARFVPRPRRPPDRSGEVTLLMAARVDPAKMQLDVIEALRALAPDDVRLVVAGFRGESDYERAVAAAAPGVRPVVELRPATDDVAPLYAAADVVVAVRRDPEPFGLTVVEAMMSGRPVLAGRVGGPAETVVDDVTGWLADDLSPAGLRAALARVLADRDRWPDLGAAGAAHAARRFTPRRQAARYRALVGL